MCNKMGLAPINRVDSLGVCGMVHVQGVGGMAMTRDQEILERARLLPRDAAASLLSLHTLAANSGAKCASSVHASTPPTLPFAPARTPPASHARPGQLLKFAQSPASHALSWTFRMWVMDKQDIL